MAARRGVDQGKTKFLERFLPVNRDTKLDEVNEAWRAEGHDDDISGSLFGKTRTRLGLTAGRGGKRGPRKSEAAPKAEAKPSRGAEAKRASAEAGVTPPQAERPEPVVARRATGSNGSPSREGVLDQIEDGIDDLTVELKQLGGMEEALRALREVRRIVVRSHEG